MERLEPSEAQLRMRPCWAPVAVDHLTRTMPRSVGHPRLAPPVGQAHGHEGGPQIVQTNGSASFAALEQLRPPHARSLQVQPEVVCTDIERTPVRASEDQCIGGRPGMTRMMMFAPGFKGQADPSVERPGTRVVRLVGVEANDAAREIEIAPRERLRFSSPQPLTHKDSVEETAEISGISVLTRSAASSSGTRFDERIQLVEFARYERESRRQAVESRVGGSTEDGYHPTRDGITSVARVCKARRALVDHDQCTGAALLEVLLDSLVQGPDRRDDAPEVVLVHAGVRSPEDEIEGVRDAVTETERGDLLTARCVGVGPPVLAEDERASRPSKRIDPARPVDVRPLGVLVEGFLELSLGVGRHPSQQGPLVGLSLRWRGHERLPTPTSMIASTRAKKGGMKKILCLAALAGCVIQSACNPTPSGQVPAGANSQVVTVGSGDHVAGPSLSVADAGADACEARVGELAGWLKSVVAEGEFAREVGPYGKQLLAKASLPPAWLKPGPEMKVAPNQIQLDGMLLGSSRAEVVAKLRTDLAAKRKLAKELGNKEPLPLTVYVARNATWARVVEVAEMLETAGEPDVQFVVEASDSKLAPPPRSVITEEMERVSRGEVPITPARIKQILDRPQSPELSRCEPARRLNEEVASEPHSPRSKLEKLAREMPARIRSCSCDVDMDAVKTRYWATLQRFAGRPVAGITLSLSKTGVPLKARGAETWQETVERVSSASRDGKPIHLVAQ